jgi:hypothetical protein
LVYEDIKERTINEFKNEQLVLAKTASQGITSFFDDCQSDATFLSQFNGIDDNLYTCLCQPIKFLIISPV